MGILRKVGTALADNYERAATKIVDTIADSVKSVGTFASDIADDVGSSAKNAKSTIKQSVANFNNNVSNPMPKAPASTKGFKAKAKNAKNSFLDNVVLTHNTRQVGPVSVSTRGGLLDELVYHVRGAQNAAIGAWDFATNGVGEKHVGQLLKRSNDSLLGYKTTGLGTGFAFAGAFAAGAPSAGREFSEARQGQFAGTYQMGAVPGLTPQGHAYANNAGATGDLVLALNNNR